MTHPPREREVSGRRRAGHAEGEEGEGYMGTMQQGLLIC